MRSSIPVTLQKERCYIINRNDSGRRMRTLNAEEKGPLGVVVSGLKMLFEALLGRGLRGGGSLFLSLARKGASIRATSFSSAPGVCWSCGADLPSASPRFFCPSCRALQPPEPGRDHFRIMGCDRRFRLDVPRLQKTFRDLQRSLHPDFFSRRNQAEREFSEQHSSLVNEAYRTLLDPLRRGIHLLELSGVAPEQGTDAGADAGFLAEVMEANEAIAEAHGDDAKMADVEKLIAAKKAELTESVTAAFDRGDLQDAKSLLAKMKYLANLEEKVKAKKIPT